MPPKLYEIFDKSYNGEYVRVRLSDGREVECLVDCPTCINKSDDDDTDVPALRVIYKNGESELLIEEDIKEVL